MPGIYANYTDIRNNYVNGQFFSNDIIDRYRRTTLSEETIIVLEDLLGGCNERGISLLKDLLIKLVFEDKNFANSLRRYLSQSMTMETE